MKYQGDSDLKPLLRFLRDRKWPQRVETYDRLGTKGMIVMLEPAPTDEQLRELLAEVGDAYEFSEVRAYFQMPHSTEE